MNYIWACPKGPNRCRESMGIPGCGQESRHSGGTHGELVGGEGSVG